MMRYFTLIVTIIASQIIFAQKKPKPECFLSMDIPSRLLVISSGEKEVVYRDKKTNAILTFTKVGLTDYEFDLNSTADRFVEELHEVPNYEGLGKETLDYSYADVVMINWTNKKVSPNLRNNHNTMALMDVCRQYYTFRFSMPSSKQEAVMPMLMEILASVETVK